MQLQSSRASLCATDRVTLCDAHADLGPHMQPSSGLHCYCIVRKSILGLIARSLMHNTTVKVDQPLMRGLDEAADLCSVLLGVICCSLEHVCGTVRCGAQDESTSRSLSNQKDGCYTQNVWHAFATRRFCCCLPSLHMLHFKVATSTVCGCQNLAKTISSKLHMLLQVRLFS